MAPCTVTRPQPPRNLGHYERSFNPCCYTPYTALFVLLFFQTCPWQLNAKENRLVAKMEMRKQALHHQVKHEKIVENIQVKRERVCMCEKVEKVLLFSDLEDFSN